MRIENPESEKDGTGYSSDRPCGLLRRLVIMLYDTFAVIALLIFATALIMLAGFEEPRAMRDPLYTLYLLTVWFAYLAWCWRKGGMTVGMRAWRVRIRNDEGGYPGWTQCLVRFLCSFASLAAAGAGFFWSLFEPDKRTWHDMASRTRLTRY